MIRISITPMFLPLTQNLFFSRLYGSALLGMWCCIFSSPLKFNGYVFFPYPPPRLIAEPICAPTSPVRPCFLLSFLEFLFFSHSQLPTFRRFANPPCLFFCGVSASNPPVLFFPFLMHIAPGPLHPLVCCFREHNG